MFSAGLQDPNPSAAYTSQGIKTRTPQVVPLKAPLKQKRQMWRVYYLKDL